MAHRILVPALIAVCAVLAPAAASAATTPAPMGALTQLSGADGCVVGAGSPVRGCATARALAGPGPFVGSGALAPSPDGRHLYVAASKANAVVAFARDARTGVLTQPAGAAGCIAAGGADGCATATGLAGTSSVAVSPDGRSVFAAGRDSGSLVVFARDAATGALAQTACFAAGDPACTPTPALGGADVVAVSPDGRSVYVGAFTGNALTIFSRDPGSGTLTRTGCLAAADDDGCTVVPGLVGVEGIAVSPDGASVSVAGALANALLAFDRGPDGALTPAGCLGSAVSGCQPARALGGPNAVAVAPDGATVYTAAVISNGMAILQRGAGGALTQATGAAACIAALPAAGCSLGHGIARPEGLAVSPDGATVYIASFGGALAVFDATDRQLRGRAGCLTATRTLGCARARALRGASSVAVSPDGRFVYAASFVSGAVTVFRRATRG